MNCKMPKIEIKSKNWNNPDIHYWQTNVINLYLLIFIILCFNAIFVNGIVKYIDIFAAITIMIPYVILMREMQKENKK